MSLATYQEARPWAKAIKEEVLTRRMPRWHVVRGYGDFANDPSLSAFEIALLASWADGGAPASAKSSTSATANKAAERPAEKVAGPSKTRTVTVPCGDRAFAPGRLLALKPALDEGASVRITLVRTDGSEEPLIWLQDFDPAFPETYWFRVPVTLSRGMRMLTDTNRCSVVLTYAG